MPETPKNPEEVIINVTPTKTPEEELPKVSDDLIDYLDELGGSEKKDDPAWASSPKTPKKPSSPEDEEDKQFVKKITGSWKKKLLIALAAVGIGGAIWSTLDGNNEPKKQSTQATAPEKPAEKEPQKTKPSEQEKPRVVAGETTPEATKTTTPEEKEKEEAKPETPGKPKLEEKKPQEPAKTTTPEEKKPEIIIQLDEEMRKEIEKLIPIAKEARERARKNTEEQEKAIEAFGKKLSKE